MSRFERRSPPHLNVRSANLVYLTGVPLTITGRDIKRRIENQFGRVRFIETFEAWHGGLTGNMIIDFSTTGESEAFMTAVVNGNVRYLDGVGIQHVGIVGQRQFFELVHRNTGIDMLDCDGRPNTEKWANNRRQLRPKPYDRSAASNRRGRSPAGKNNNRNDDSTVSRATRDRNSPSSEESFGPFPSSSRTFRNFVKGAIWQPKKSGRTHILTFHTPVNAIERDRRRSRSRPRHRLLHSRSPEAPPIFRIHSNSPPLPSVQRSRTRSFGGGNGRSGSRRWQSGSGDERNGHRSDERISPRDVVGLDMTKNRMRKERRRHHRFLRTPSPQWLDDKNASHRQRRGRSQSRSRYDPPRPSSRRRGSCPQSMTIMARPKMREEMEPGEIILLTDSMSIGTNNNGVGPHSASFSTATTQPAAPAKLGTTTAPHSPAPRRRRRPITELEEGELPDSDEEEDEGEEEPMETGESTDPPEEEEGYEEDDLILLADDDDDDNNYGPSAIRRLPSVGITQETQTGKEDHLVGADDDLFDGTDVASDIDERVLDESGDEEGEHGEEDEEEDNNANRHESTDSSMVVEEEGGGDVDEDIFFLGTTFRRISIEGAERVGEWAKRVKQEIVEEAVEDGMEQQEPTTANVPVTGINMDEHHPAPAYK